MGLFKTIIRTIYLYLFDRSEYDKYNTVEFLHSLINVERKKSNPNYDKIRHYKEAIIKFNISR